MRLLFSLILLTFTIVFQPSFRGWILLANFVPILIAMWAWRLDVFDLIVMTISGALLHDFLMGDGLGMGPFIWCALVFVVRSQRIMLNIYGIMFACLVVFTTSFLYFILSRLAYLAAREMWAWDQELWLHIFLASLLNALLTPIVFMVLKPFYPTSNVKVTETVRYSHGNP